MSSTPALPSEDWYSDIIDTMLRERATFEQAAVLLGMRALTAEEAAGHKRRKSFRDQYEAMARQFYERQGDSADATKNRLVGEMRVLAARLTEAGKFKEAADVLASSAKILGYTGADVAVSFWDGLTGLDIEELRRRLGPKPAPTSKPN